MSNNINFLGFYSIHFKFSKKYDFDKHLKDTQERNEPDLVTIRGGLKQLKTHCHRSWNLPSFLTTEVEFSWLQPWRLFSGRLADAVLYTSINISSWGWGDITFVKTFMLKP